MSGLENLYRDKENPDFSCEKADYEFIVNQKPFNLIVKRKSTNEEILNTDVTEFIYSDYYIQIGTKMPTPFIFGMGERNTKSLRLKEGEYTLYGRDVPSLVE